MDSSEKYSPVNILLIEDNPVDARIIQEVFNEGKIKTKISVVDDGEKALFFLRKTDKYKDAETPDLILLDLNLPQTNSWEILSEIKSNPKLSSIPVIVLVPPSWDEDVLRNYYHANSYIKKPVEREEFINVIKSIEEFWLTVVVLPRKQN